MTAQNVSAPQMPPREAGGELRPGSEELTLKTEQLQIERKHFTLALKENPRGRFLRITEDVRGRRDKIIIPAPGLPEFRRVLDDMVKAAEELPCPAETPRAVNE